MDVKECQNLDQKLKIVYKCVRSLFNKIDKNLYFNLQNEKLKFDIYLRGFVNITMLLNYYKKLNIKDRFCFSFCCLKVEKYNKHYDSDKYTFYGRTGLDVEIGYFFPYHKIGDSIEISFVNYDGAYPTNDICRIDITDTNKIYLLHNDKKFIVGSHGFDTRYIKSTNNTPMYIIGALFNNNYSNQLQKFIAWNRNIRYKFTYAEEASSEIIQKAWKNYVKRRNIRQFTKWTKCINDVNNELEYFPDFGIKYFEAKKNFDCLSF